MHLIAVTAQRTLVLVVVPPSVSPAARAPAALAMIPVLLLGILLRDPLPELLAAMIHYVPLPALAFPLGADLGLVSLLNLSYRDTAGGLPQLAGVFPLQLGALLPHLCLEALSLLILALD